MSAPGAGTDATRPTRRPLVAGLLSLVTLGLGDVYNGQAAKGALLWAIATGSAALAAVAYTAALMMAPSFGLTLGGVGALVALVLGFRTFGAIRAVRDARRLRHAPAPRSRLLWCAGFLVATWLASDVLATGVRGLLVQAYRIPSGAMQPTLSIGDHLLVAKFGEVNVGDVVVFLAPAAASRDGQRLDFIKRVVAVGGQTIEVRSKQVFVDGKASDDAHAFFRTGRPDPAAPLAAGLKPCGSMEAGAGDSCTPYIVPPGHVFVMGDNREQSYDSRYWGPVPLADVHGRAFVVYWSWTDAGVAWDRIGRRID